MSGRIEKRADTGAVARRHRKARDDGGLSRRALLRAGAAAGIAAPLVPGLLARAQEAAEAPKPGAAEIMACSRVIDLPLTEHETEQLARTIEENLGAIRALRALNLENDVAPATIFRPLPNGEAPPAVKPGVRGIRADTRRKPGGEEDVAFAPLADLGHWIRTKQISSRELTRLYLDRIARYDPLLLAFITVTEDLAIQEAAARDEETAKGRIRGPLHGIPYGLKDLVDTAGIRTTWGAMPYKDRVPAQDAAIVEKLRAAGAVLLGKTTDGAIAYGDIWFGGRTRNPWNPLEGSSGSSAGSASATAAGLVAFSIGTETLGSIVSPSNRCGTVGLRPTFGRVSRHGAMALCWSLDKIGPICRHVADTALVLAAINGFDPRDAASVAADFGWNAGEKRSLRIAHDEAWFKDAADADKAALAALKAMPGVTLETVSLPDWPYAGLFSVVEIEAAAAFQELTLSGRDDLMVWQDDNAWPNTWRKAHFFPAVDFVNAQRFRRRVMEMMWEKLDRAGIDALISPNYAGNLLVITNFTGHPCLTIPAGFIETPTRTGFGNQADEQAPRFRVPRNVTLWGPLFREDRLLAIGARLEQALGLAPQLRPPLERWMAEYDGRAPEMSKPEPQPA
ncbi:MAG: amidase [Rhodothalassiaceae bacterium]|nr:MAG: amidase [Rhodothalassiaceae bacterium]